MRFDANESLPLNREAERILNEIRAVTYQEWAADEASRSRLYREWGDFERAIFCQEWSAHWAKSARVRMGIE